MADLANDGLLQKAILEIINQQPDEITVTDAQAKSSPGIDTKGLNAKASNALSPGGSNNTSSSENEVIRFAVQFNPTELSIAADGAEEAQDYVADAAGSGSVIGKRQLSSRARVSFRLIFDDTDNEDAFLSESSILHPDTVKKNAGNYRSSPERLMNINGNRKDQKEHGVRSQVEGLLAALRNEYTRKVSFIWGNLCYSGYLNTVQAEYKMFNPDGSPIRAEIRIGILCMDENLEQGNMGQWQKHYEELTNHLRS